MWSGRSGADPGFSDGGFARALRAEIFSCHAHFICCFRVLELRARILFYTRPTLYSAILMRAIGQIAEQDWHSSAECQGRWK